MKWKERLRHGVNVLGWNVRPVLPADPPLDLADLTADERAIVHQVARFTQTSDARLASLLRAVRHVVVHRIPGHIAECGVWRGGSMMAAALMLQALGDVSRELHLFDTFEGMPAPTSLDMDHRGERASDLLLNRATVDAVACVADVDEVRRNVLSTGYPADRVHFVQGRVEDTLPARAPDELSILRLDTDWYESTRHELIHLYPRLSSWGVLILDDYGHWQGARKAIDEFCASLPYPAFLHRIDYTGRLLIKPMQ